MHRRRHAFTVIEMLVVLGIIAVLAALLFPVLTQALLAARGAKTATRMQDLLRHVAALNAVGDEVTLAERLHTGIAAVAPAGAVEGVTVFKLDQRTHERVPQQGTWIAPPWKPYHFPHPWGKVPTDLPGDAPAALPATTDVLTVEAHGLDDLTARFSAEVFAVAGLLPPDVATTAAHDGIAAYRTDRSAERAWNDAWGNPLLVGFALYHPRQNTLIANAGTVMLRADSFRNRPDLFLRRALDAYGFYRAVYLAPAAMGPKLPAGITRAELADAAGDWDTHLTGLLDRAWTSVMGVANRDPSGAQLCRSDGSVQPPLDPIARPPWTGVRRAKSSGAVCWVHAPMEYR